MHPEVADEANPDTKASTTVRAEVGRCCAVSAGGSGFCVQHVSAQLGGLSANVEFFQGDLWAVLKIVLFALRLWACPEKVLHE